MYFFIYTLYLQDIETNWRGVVAALEYELL